MEPQEYQQQIETGKGIVEELLKALSVDLGKPPMNIEWKRTPKDFDNNELFDLRHRPEENRCKG